MNKSIDWEKRYNAAEKRLNSNPAKIAPQVIFKPAISWAGLAKLNAKRQAIANAKACFDLAHCYLKAGKVQMARLRIAQGRVELEAAKVLARIC